MAQTDIYLVGSTTAIEPTITIGALTDDTARQSAKTDFRVSTTGNCSGQNCLFTSCAVHFQIDTGATVTNIETVELFASFSPSSTAATDNACGASGSDAAYTGYSGNLTASLSSCTLLYILTLTAVADQEHVGTFSFRPPMSHANFIVVNRSTQTLGTAHDLDMYCTHPESQ